MTVVQCIQTTAALGQIYLSLLALGVWAATYSTLGDFGNA